MKILIQNFGPIAEGTCEKYIEISNYTVLIGSQGSGKSSLAKLVSLFSWLEKALMRRTLTEREVSRKNQFKNKYCAYNRLSSFFKPDTEIECICDYYTFSYKDEQLIVKKIDNNLTDDLYLPKVMYIPAERNLLSITNKVGIVKYYSDSLRTFWETYEEYCREIKGDIELPLDNVKFSYDKLNQISWIKDDNVTYKTRLIESASGYQAMVPLYLVSKYIYGLVANNRKESIKIDATQYQRLKKDIDNLLKNNEISEEIKEMLIKKMSSLFSYSYVTNIVEEPELNLYPESQNLLIQELVGLNNSNKFNKLLITTHSPYVLTTLNNLLYASQVAKLESEKVENIIPKEYWISSESLRAYEMRDGKIENIFDEELHMIKAEEIDRISCKINKQFDELIEIEG